MSRLCLTSSRTVTDSQVLHPRDRLGEEVRYSYSARLPCPSRITERMESLWQIGTDQLDDWSDGYCQRSKTSRDPAKLDAIHLSTWYQRGGSNVSDEVIIPDLVDEIPDNRRLSLVNEVQSEMTSLASMQAL